MSTELINPVKLRDKKQEQAMRAIVLANANAKSWVKLRRQDDFKLVGNTDIEYGLLNSVYIKPIGKDKYQCYVVSTEYAKGNFCKVFDILRVFEVDANNSKQPITDIKMEHDLVMKRPYSTASKKPLAPRPGIEYDPDEPPLAPRLAEDKKPIPLAEQMERALKDDSFSIYFHEYVKRINLANTLQQNELDTAHALKSKIQKVSITTQKPYINDSSHTVTKEALIMLRVGDADLDSRKPEEFNDTQLQSMVLTLCQSLQQLHDNGRIHRDIKRGNIRISKSSGKMVAELIDFGLNCQAQSEQVFAGSPAYLPGEVWTSYYSKIDYSMDIYALSLTLFRLIFAKDWQSFHPKCIEHHPIEERGYPRYRERIARLIEDNTKTVEVLPGDKWLELYKLIELGLDVDPKKRPMINQFIEVCKQLPTNKPKQDPSHQRTALSC